MMVAPVTQDGPRLRAQLGQFDAVATGLAAILGAGIFAVIAPAAGVAGPALLISLVLAAAVAFCNAISSAQLAAILPRTGGTYAFGRQMLGPWWGFLAGWMFLTANTVGPGVIALAFGSYLHAAWGVLPARPMAVAAALAATALNAVGIRRSVRVTDVVVVLSVLCLLLVVVLGLPAAHSAHLAPFAPHGAGGVVRGAALLFFAYTGYSRIATLVEEVRDPARTIPRATTLALGGAALLYLLVAGTAVAVLGAPAMARSTSPLRDTVLVAGSAIGPAVVAAGALLTTFNEALSDLLGVSRVAFAMARGGDLPARLAHLGRGDNPWPSVVAVGAVAVLIAAVAPFGAAVALSSFGTLLYYAITNLAALRLQAVQRTFPRWLAVAGLMGCVGLATMLAPREIIVGLGIAALGLLARAARLGVERARNRGTVG